MTDQNCMLRLKIRRRYFRTDLLLFELKNVASEVCRDKLLSSFKSLLLESVQQSCLTATRQPDQPTDQHINSSKCDVTQFCVKYVAKNVDTGDNTVVLKIF